MGMLAGECAEDLVRKNGYFTRVFRVEMPLSNLYHAHFFILLFSEIAQPLQIFAMPKEHRKRGRREEKKRKREEEEDQAAASKRQKSDDAEDVEIIVDGGIGAGPQEGYPVSALPPGDLPFYGLLGEDEQEYFKRADSMLELNQFPDPEERNLFLANVYKEANGKELKIANSQSCSRLMERLILLSTPDQLKKLFQKFSGQ